MSEFFLHLSNLLVEIFAVFIPKPVQFLFCDFLGGEFYIIGDFNSTRVHETHFFFANE